MWWLALLALLLLLLSSIWVNLWLLNFALLQLVLLAILSRLWLRHTTSHLHASRELTERAFQGDKIEVKLSVRNGTFLPLPWVHLHELLPSGLKAFPEPDWLVSLASRQEQTMSYQLECLKRGRYRIGPLEARPGVLLDAGSEPSGNLLKWENASRLVVYPLVMPLEQLLLPGRLPLGPLRTRRLLLPDPSRLAGIYEYQPGDDPRFIDWRNTARVNHLVVKQFERTRLTPLAIFLDLRPVSLRSRWERPSETSIVVAASLTARANQLKQSFGLYSNGFDPGWSESSWSAQNQGRPEMRPRSGSGWLYEVLDTLAGIQVAPGASPIEQLMGAWSSELPWGSTVVLLSFEPTMALTLEVARLQSAGFNMVVIFTAASADAVSSQTRESLNRLSNLGITVHQIKSAQELNSATALV